MTSRRLHTEPLEARLLLAGDMTVRFAFADMGGESSDFLMVGSDYTLQVYVRDSRSQPTGVQQAYFDVNYDSSLISVTQAVAAGAQYQLQSAGDTTTDGLIDEAGGADSDTTPPTPPGTELLLFTVPIRVESAGTLQLTTDLSELTARLPKFFLSESVVPLGSIEFVGTSITIRDAAIIISPTAGLQTSELAGTDSFQISLQTAPSSNVTINLSSSDTSEGTVSPGSVVFTPVNWSIPQTVTVQGVDDAVADGNISYEIVTQPAVSSDTHYSGRDAANISVTNIDNDTAGITVQPTSGETSESGSTETFQIVLDSQPLANVTIAVASGDPSEGTVAPSGVVFTAENWNVPQVVTVTGVNDNVADGNQVYLIVTEAAVSLDPEYNGRSVADVSITNLDDDAAGITVQPTTGQTSEAGATASFSIVLTSQPLADVTIDLASSNPAEGTVSSSSVVFTPVNWNTPQTIVVTGQDDNISDGNTAYSIITSAAVSTDSAYNNRTVADVSLTNVDNDSAGIQVVPTTGQTSEAGGTATFAITLSSRPTASVTIALSSSDTSEGTVSPASITITPDNWNTPHQVTVTGVDDPDIDGLQTYTVMTAPAVSTDPKYNQRNPADVTITNSDNDTLAIIVTPLTGETTEAGGTATFTVVLGSRPAANVSIDLSSSDVGEGTVSPATLTFTAANWNQPQSVVVTGQDDPQRDGDIAYHIVTSNARSDDPNYNNRTVEDVAVTNLDDDVASVVVTPITGLVTGEDGRTATFTVRLSSQPTADVTLTLSSSNVNEGTVSPASLLWTTENWDQPQIVTVTGVDDSVDDDDVLYTIVTSAAVSTDSFYNNLAVDDVQVVNQDDDQAAILISPTSGLVTSEAGGQTSFSVVLTTQPTSNVTVTVTSDDASEATVTPGQLTFTPANWNSVQQVTVVGVDDSWVDGDVAYTITARASGGDEVFQNLSPTIISAMNQDNDTAQLILSAASSSVVEGTGEIMTPATFTVTLVGAVEGGLTVAVATIDGSATAAGNDYVSLSDTLTFAGADDESHSVNVSVVADDMLEPDETFQVSLGVLGGISASAAARITLSDSPLQFTVVDDDEPVISFFAVSQEEGTGETASVFAFDVVLSNPVQGGLTIEYSTSDGTATVAGHDYVAKSGLLEFLGTANEKHTIEITVNADNAVERAESFTVSLDKINFLDPALAEVIEAEGASQTGTILNDDTATIAFELSDSLIVETADHRLINVRLAVSNGGTLTEDITLDVSVLPGGTATSPEDFILSQTSITFPAGSQDGAVQAIDVDIITDDVEEEEEQLTLQLTMTGNGMDGAVALVAPSQHVATIFEDPMTASVSGKVWLDTNGNGRQETGELPIPGVFVTLSGIDLGDRVVEIVRMTDALGNYQFTQLPGGTYTVRESQPAAFFDGVDALGTVAGQRQGQLQNDQFADIVLPPEAQGANYNFGELQLAQPPISARMFFASSSTLSQHMREVVARAEQLRGNTAQAEAIRHVESVEMRRIANLVTLTGTTQDDWFSFVPAGSLEATDSTRHAVTINGLTWDFAAEQIDQVLFLGGEGMDELELLDSSLDDSLALSHDQAILSSADFRLEAMAMELVRATSSSGGTDTFTRDEVEMIVQLEGPWVEPPDEPAEPLRARRP